MCRSFCDSAAAPTITTPWLPQPHSRRDPSGMAVRKFVLPADAGNVPPTSRWPSRYREFVVSGGGTRNATLMRMIREELAPLKMRVRTTDDFGSAIGGERGRRLRAAGLSDVAATCRQIFPSATGAKHPAILGKVSYA